MFKKYRYIAALLIASVCCFSVVQAESNQVSIKTADCAACDEPLPGTALWHYMKGIEELLGVRTNPYLANEHFSRAAEMHYAPAIKALADSYYSGDGVAQDKQKALELYIKAANLGDGAAQFNAGVILLKGYAGEPNTSLAYYYLCLATMNEGLDEMAQDAAIYRDEAGNVLKPDQLRDIYRKLVNNPATKPNKGSLKRAPNPDLKLKGPLQEKPSTLSSENQGQR